MPTLPNLAGLRYGGPFYDMRIPREVREERRRMVTHYVPHTFRDCGPGPRSALCRICGFPKADAACAAI